MNARIRELNMQAAEYATSVCPTHSRDWYPIQNTKFAELIVRECAGACLHDDWEDPRWGRFYANKIREHFGVEK